jgi:phosphoribosylglycinamide formyltransferase-1|tara:strand:- start:694 stop:1275 length:582 start_codon:yes stop_codon:yes gene_type:complete
MKISFLASHGGSSAKAIIQAINNGDLDAKAGIVITNNKDSGIYLWCLEHNIPVFHISSTTHPSSSAADSSILITLKQANTDIVVCSGYMKKIGPNTLSGFSGKILNIHPALLPRHGGEGMYGDKVHTAVLNAGETETGATVHLVNENYDDGPILGQSHVEVLQSDTLESLRQKVQATEPGLYIDCLKSFLTKL